MRAATTGAWAWPAARARAARRVARLSLTLSAVSETARARGPRARPRDKHDMPDVAFAANLYSFNCAKLRGIPTERVVLCVW